MKTEKLTEAMKFDIWKGSVFDFSLSALYVQYFLAAQAFAAHGIVLCFVGLAFAVEVVVVFGWGGFVVGFVVCLFGVDWLGLPWVWYFFPTESLHFIFQGDCHRVF